MHGTTIKKLKIQFSIKGTELYTTLENTFKCQIILTVGHFTHCRTSSLF